MAAQALLTQFPRISTVLIPPSSKLSVSLGQIGNNFKNIFTGSGSGVLKTGVKVGAGATAVGLGGVAVNESLKSITSPVENLLGVENGSISGIVIIGAILVFLILVMKR
jgi:hypothetical protein